MNARWTLASAFFLTLLVAGLAPVAEAQPAARGIDDPSEVAVSNDVEALVESLRHRSWEVRERATERLIEIADGDVLERLRSARDHRDPEIRARARQVLESVNPVWVQLRLRRWNFATHPPTLEEEFAWELERGRTVTTRTDDDLPLTIRFQRVRRDESGKRYEFDIGVDDTARSQEGASRSIGLHHGHIVIAREAARIFGKVVGARPETRVEPITWTAELLGSGTLLEKYTIDESGLDIYSATGARIRSLAGDDAARQGMQRLAVRFGLASSLDAHAPKFVKLAGQLVADGVRPEDPRVLEVAESLPDALVTPLDVELGIVAARAGNRTGMERLGNRIVEEPLARQYEIIEAIREGVRARPENAAAAFDALFAHTEFLRWGTVDVFETAFVELAQAIGKEAFRTRLPAFFEDFARLRLTTLGDIVLQLIDDLGLGTKVLEDERVLGTAERAFVDGGAAQAMFLWFVRANREGTLSDERFAEILARCGQVQTPVQLVEELEALSTDVDLSPTLRQAVWIARAQILPHAGHRARLIDNALAERFGEISGPQPARDDTDGWSARRDLWLARVEAAPPVEAERSETTVVVSSVICETGVDDSPHGIVVDWASVAVEVGTSHFGKTAGGADYLVQPRESAQRARRPGANEPMIRVRRGTSMSSPSAPPADHLTYRVNRQVVGTGNTFSRLPGTPRFIEILLVEIGDTPYSSQEAIIERVVDAALHDEGRSVQLSRQLIERVKLREMLEPLAREIDGESPVDLHRLLVQVGGEIDPERRDEILNLADRKGTAALIALVERGDEAAIGLALQVVEAPTQQNRYFVRPLIDALRKRWMSETPPNRESFDADRWTSALVRGLGDPDAGNTRNYAAVPWRDATQLLRVVTGQDFGFDLIYERDPEDRRNEEKRVIRLWLDWHAEQAPR